MDDVLRTIFQTFFLISTKLLGGRGPLENRIHLPSPFPLPHLDSPSLSLPFSSESRFPKNGLPQFLGRKNEVSEFSKMCACSATEVHYSLHFCRYILRNEKAVFSTFSF